MKTIIHVIESLVIGGAEMLLVNNINALTNYRNILVTINPTNEFNDINCEKLICLNHRGKSKTFETVKKLRKIIKDEKADIVHSHLLKADFFSRLATPKNIPLFFTVHNRTSDTFSKYFGKYLRESLTYSKRHTPIFVSKDAMQDYNSKIPIKGQYHVLYNYADEKFHNAKKYQYHTNKKEINMVMVGSFKKQKNHQFIINALNVLDDSSFKLHLYGEGGLKDGLIEEVNNKGLNDSVFFNNNIATLENKLPDFDLFIMPSLKEGFSIALLEAITLGMPCVLSDIPSFKEMLTNKEALFFDLNNENSIIEVLKKIKQDPSILDQLSKNTIEKSKIYQNKKEYIKSLNQIYEKVLVS